MPVVSFTHDREQIRISVAILPPLDSPQPWRLKTASGLIDTGAVSSGITTEIAAELQLPRLGKTTITTPGGEYVAPRYQFRMGLFPDGLRQDGEPSMPFVLERELLGIGASSGQRFSVLIGMDVIGQGDLIVRRDGSGCFSFGRPG